MRLPNSLKAPRTQLVVLLLVTAAVWSGSMRVGFSTDDFLFIHHLAPIRSLSDVLRPFYSIDPNLEYWRPLADASAALDFYIWGWNGQGFHVSNFLFHLLATWLVYKTALHIFRMEIREALATAFLFGIAASHESNVLWPAARADELATICTMAALVWHRRATDSLRPAILLFGSYLAFLLAMCSKENGVLAFPLILALVEFPRLIKKQSTVGSAAIRTLPYLLLTLAFFSVRAHFALPMSQTEPIVSEGSHSLFAFLRNGIIGAGYAILPLDLEQGMSLLEHSRNIAFVALLILPLVWLVVSMHRLGARRYLPPLVFLLISGVVVMQSFERWRFYMPSVGLFALCVLFVRSAWSMTKQSSNGIRYASRAVIAVLVAALIGFHLMRALSAEENWRLAATKVEALKSNLKHLLAANPERPISLDFLTVPAKLGSASIMQVGLPEFLRECEAEHRNLPEHRFGVATGNDIPVTRAIDVYALDLETGFDSIYLVRLSNGEYHVSVPDRSSTLLEPAIFKLNGASRRDWKVRDNDTLTAGPHRIIVRAAAGSFVRAADVSTSDTTSLRLFFNGQEFVVLR